MSHGYFITGTDTNVGKTWATLALMHAIKQQGKTVVGMKPVASGCTTENGELRNADALAIQDCASVLVPYDWLNPYAYQLPVSPHLADPNHPVDIAHIVARFQQLRALADVIIVEGAGGWYTPVNDQETIADVARALGLPVIMVVAMRLGCINHACLTYQAIQHSAVSCAGWLAVCNDRELTMADAVLHSLKNRLPVPLLGVLPYTESADFSVLASYLSLIASTFEKV
jgi:dethiobiotin synthetase